MRRSDLERALRRAAAGLASLHPDDAAAILAALDDEERARLDRAVAGEPEPSVLPERWSYDGVSPWLLDRIEPDKRPRRRGATDFILITPATSQALHAAAAPFRGEAHPSERRSGTSLIGRLLHRLGGGGK